MKSHPVFLCLHSEQTQQSFKSCSGVNFPDFLVRIFRFVQERQVKYLGLSAYFTLHLIWRSLREKNKFEV